jgi:hypothetical protein
VKLVWTPEVRSRWLPFPGEPWTLAPEPHPDVPSGPSVADEIARGLALRLQHRYDATTGMRPRDTHGRQLVDAWCERAGVAFATEVLIAIACTLLPKDPRNPVERPYAIRHDGQPWGRLREQLAVAPAAQRARAHELAAAARDAPGELRFGLAYAFCDDAWVAEDRDAALTGGYGRLAVIASLRDAAQARAVLERMLDPTYTRFQLVEEAVPHVPNLMRRLDPADGELIVRAASLAWSKPSRRPWLPLVACYDGEAAHAFLDAHDQELELSAAPPRKRIKKRPARTATKKATKKAAKTARRR